jgi:hypothetical protein
VPLSRRLKEPRWSPRGSPQLRDGLRERGTQPSPANLYFVSLKPWSIQGIIVRKSLPTSSMSEP